MTANHEDIRGIITDFKKLATKIQKDNGEVKKKLRERETVLAACQKEYEKLYYAHETLKEKYKQLEQKIQRTKPKKRYYVVDENEDEADDEWQNEEVKSEIENQHEVEYVTVKKKTPQASQSTPAGQPSKKRKQYLKRKKRPKREYLTL